MYANAFKLEAINKTLIQYAVVKSCIEHNKIKTRTFTKGWQRLRQIADKISSRLSKWRRPRVRTKEKGREEKPGTT